MEEQGDVAVEADLGRWPTLAWGRAFGPHAD